MEVDMLLAYCGLKCEGCQIYLATMETDKEKQSKMRVQIVNSSISKSHLEDIRSSINGDYS